MIYSKYTDTEINQLLESIIILIDTREKKIDHIEDYFNKQGIKYSMEKLDHGDYTCMLPKNKELGIYRNMYLNDVISIERKASLEELSGNFTKGRRQIENEFLRSRGKMILLIENGSYEDIILHRYKTKYDPRSFVATLKAFESRYNLQTNFINKVYTGNFIYFTLYYAVRELLKNGNIKQAI